MQKLIVPYSMCRMTLVRSNNFVHPQYHQALERCESQRCTETDSASVFRRDFHHRSLRAGQQLAEKKWVSGVDIRRHCTAESTNLTIPTFSKRLSPALTKHNLSQPQPYHACDTPTYYIKPRTRDEYEESTRVGFSEHPPHNNRIGAKRRQEGQQVNTPHGSHKIRSVCQSSQQRVALRSRMHPDSTPQEQRQEQNAAQHQQRLPVGQRRLPR